MTVIGIDVFKASGVANKRAVGTLVSTPITFQLQLYLQTILSVARQLAKPWK